MGGFNEHKNNHRIMNIIEIGQVWIPKENEKLFYKKTFLFDFDYIEIISLETSYEFFVFFIKEDKVICADYLAKNKILFNYIFDEIRTNNKIIREIIE